MNTPIDSSPAPPRRRHQQASLRQAGRDAALLRGRKEGDLLRAVRQADLLPPRGVALFGMRLPVIEPAMSSSPSTPEPIDGRVIWQAFSCRLRAFIARRVAVSADVDDILQSVFLNMPRHREALGHGDRVEAWLYRATRNAIVDHYRARGREPSPMGDEPHDLPEVFDETSSGTSVGAEIARCLAPMLERLPARYQQILALTDLGGATMVQASERLGLSVSGAKTRAQRGRALLKKQVLSCCRIDLDARGSVIGYECQSGACGDGGPATPSTRGGCSD